MKDTRQLVPLDVMERAMTTAWNVVRVRPRPALIAVALAAFTLGVLMEWGLLVAGGIAAIVIWALPCAVICALGLYMSRMDRSSSSTATGMKQRTTATCESVQLESAAARSHGPELSADPAGPIDGDAVGADQLQQQERRPTHA